MSRPGRASRHQAIPALPPCLELPAPLLLPTPTLLPGGASTTMPATSSPSILGVFMGMGAKPLRIFLQERRHRRAVLKQERARDAPARHAAAATAAGSVAHHSPAFMLVAAALISTWFGFRVGSGQSVCNTRTSGGPRRSMTTARIVAAAAAEVAQQSSGSSPSQGLRSLQALGVRHGERSKLVLEAHNAEGVIGWRGRRARAGLSLQAAQGLLRSSGSQGAAVGLLCDQRRRACWEPAGSCAEYLNAGLPPPPLVSLGSFIGGP